MGSQVHCPNENVSSGNKKRGQHPRRGLKQNGQTDEPKIVYVHYNVVEECYGQFIEKLRNKLADHPNASNVFVGHPVLAKQTSKHPARWIFINLYLATGENEEMTTTLAIRDDNLYLKAFRNKDEEWYELGKKENNKKLMHPKYNSIFLECGDNYGSLVGGDNDFEQVKRNLSQLELGKVSMENAVSKLALYNQPPDNGVDDVDPTLKQDLAQLIVMVCEPARMTKHYLTVKNAWDRDHTSQINELEVYYLWNWGNMSGALLACIRDKGYTWPTEEYFYGKPQIKNKDEALQVVHLVKDTVSPQTKRQHQQQNKKKKKESPPPSPPPADGNNDADGRQSQSQPPQADDNQAVHRKPQPPSDHPPPSVGGRQHEGAASSSQQVQAAGGAGCHGRLLVEVFALAVAANSQGKFPVVGTTIAVFDGKRGQIIRMQKQGNNLVLTGPHKAISAEGCFSIEIETPVNTLDKSTIIQSWEWDSFDNEIEYNEQYEENIGPVDITYAVLSNALEATVEVKLPPSIGRSNIHVFGKITAYNESFDVGSVLFRRDSMHKAELRSACTVPLARSVLAVRFSSKVNIEMDLHIENPDRVHFNGTVQLYCPGPPNAILQTNNGDVEVSITCYPPSAHCGGGNILHGGTTHYEEDTSEENRPADLVYNVLDGDYVAFMTEFRALLVENADREQVGNKGHVVLGRQRAKEPRRWIHIKLVAAEETTTLAIRDDNLYLKGFMNKRGDWFELIGSDQTEQSARMLPRRYNSSQTRWFIMNYGFIVAMMQQHDTCLDQSFAIDAVSRLSGYSPDQGMMPGIGDLVALAGLIVMVCESARMSSHYNTILSRNGKLTKWQLGYAQHWKRMSRALLHWKHSGDWPNDPEVGAMHITSEREAKDVVQLLLNWSPRMRAAPALPGRCLVEVLAVRADFEVVGTTITVFDGKRGQIIYTHHQLDDDHASNLDSQGNLVLTGPYKAISADGCFAIQVDIPTAAQSDDNVGDAIVWEWDGYDEVYADEVDERPHVKRRISTGPGRTVHVTYAVMSNAMEGTVRVSLPIAVGTLVYGEITAYNSTMNRVLFSRTAPGAVAVAALSADDSTVPLARPVITVPLGQCLNIRVSMHVHPDHAVKYFEGTVQFDGHSVRQFPTTHGIVEVMIIWYPAFPPSRGCV